VTVVLPADPHPLVAPFLAAGAARSTHQRRNYERTEGLAALVEDDDASEGREPFQQILVDRELPEELGVGKRSRDEDEIARAVAKDSVGDVNVTPGVADVAPHRRSSAKHPNMAAEGS